MEAPFCFLRIDQVSSHCSWTTSRIDLYASQLPGDASRKRFVGELSRSGAAELWGRRTVSDPMILGGALGFLRAGVQEVL